jgi:hypothetical protein
MMESVKIIGTVAPIEGPEKFERIEIDCTTYESGHTELLTKLPEGWRLTSIRVDS